MPTDRQVRILDLLTGHDEVHIEHLSQQLQASPSTVRRELEVMEELGLLLRTHGGARMPERVHYEQPYERRATIELEAKRAIAVAACQLVTDGAIIGISGGTTCTELARRMRAIPNLTIVTNAVNISLELYGQSDKRIIVTGGTLSQNSYELVGNMAVQTLQDIHLDMAFLGVTGMDLGFGFSMTDEPEAMVGRSFMAAASRKIVLADHTKIGKATLARLCRLSEVDVLITDRADTVEQAAILEQTGIKVLCAASAGGKNHTLAAEPGDA